MEMYISLAVAVVGLITYLLCTPGEQLKPKFAKVGEILLLAGALAFLLIIGGHKIGGL